MPALVLLCCRLPAHMKILLALALTTAVLHADDWPQWLGPQRDAIWRENGIVESFPATGPSVRWRVPVGAGTPVPRWQKGAFL